MRAIRRVLAELLGLFVDDWAFTLLVLAWLAVATLLIPAGLPDETWGAPVLFAGCAALLPLGAWLDARRRRRSAT